MGGGILLFMVYAYAVFSYLRGKSRENLERAIKALLVIGGNGGLLQIVGRGRGTVLEICRADGQADWADVRLRIPSGRWSEPYVTLIEQQLKGRGFEIMPASVDWISEVRVPVENIWTTAGAAKAAEAANTVLDALGFKRDARFVFRHRGKNSWRVMTRRA
jgi:hypothetical protein